MGVLSNNYAQIVPGALISASYVSDIYNVLMGDEPESIILSGSLTISGSTISTLGFTGSLHGTSSWAVSSSRATLATTASYAISASYINYINSSSIADLALTASYVNTAQTASYYGGSVVSSSYSITASYAVTASYALSASYTPSVLTVDTIYDLEIDADMYDAVVITSQGSDILINNPIGGVDCKPIYMALQDNNQAYNITYGDKFKAFGIALPIVTVPGKTIAYTMVYSEFYDKWNITWMLEV